MAKYSVLMSVYVKEKAEYLDSAILSMLNQTVKPDEIVLVKDGTLTPELEQVIDQYILKYPDVFTILTNETNLGLGPSLQKGVLACRNELIARMDSDDISRKDRIEKQLEMFVKDPGLSICGGNIREFKEDSFEKTIGYRIVPEHDQELKTYLKTRCPFNHMTVMYRKSEVLRAGNYQEFLYNEDYLLWINMLRSNCVFANLKDVLVDVRTSDDLYKRRGGDVYFRSEKGIQDIMLKEGIIDRWTYTKNMGKRIIVEKLMPSGIRAILFKYLARNRAYNENN